MVLEDPNFEKKVILYAMVGIAALIVSIILVVYLWYNIYKLSVDEGGPAG